ncbi:MAG: CRISPR-associated endonuclease Cas2 [Candidatus Bathyarchaeia archaeon]
MYVILVYDIGEDRVNKVLKICRKYLTWVQNSVFEGDLTEANFMRLKHELAKVIEKERDSVTFYILRTTAYMKREVLGTVKGEPLSVL